MSGTAEREGPPLDSAPPPRAPRRAVEWQRVARGLFWIGIGSLLLLNTLGHLRWSFWLDALSWWPVLLVALGLRLIFDRSRYPWAALISPLLVLGTLGWVAAAGPAGPSGDRSPVRLERSEGLVRWTLDAALSLATLEVEARALEPGLLGAGEVVAEHSPSVRTTTGSEATRVRLRSRERNFAVLWPRARESWDLAVTPDLPLSLDVRSAFVRSNFALEGAPVAGALLEGAFNHHLLRLGRPAADGDVRVHFEGAFNVIELVVPEDTPVRVSTDGFLNGVRGRRRTSGLEGPGYRVRLDGAFNRLRVRSD